MQREPLFNVPPVIVAVLAALVLVHVVRLYALSEAQDIQFLLTFAFIPARYDSAGALGAALPGGFAAEFWTFVTYSLLHADWTHLGVNSIWLLPFGTALARRFGTERFLAFFAVTAAGGAALHLATHAGEQFPMIGASAAISGCMAASMRFAFERGGPLFSRTTDAASYRAPAVPLLHVLFNLRAVSFLVVWLGINFLFGLGAQPFTGSDDQVAWQAHIGGFATGLLLFSWFDPVRRADSGDIGATRH